MSNHHWLPKQGKPMHLIDSVCQSLLRAMAYLPVYTAVIVTITMLLVIFGIPFIKG